MGESKILAHVRRFFDGHAGQQLGALRRNHHHIDLRAPMEQSIASGRAARLGSRHGAVDLALEQRLAKLPVASYTR